MPHLFAAEVGAGVGAQWLFPFPLTRGPWTSLIPKASLVDSSGDHLEGLAQLSGPSLFSFRASSPQLLKTLKSSEFGLGSLRALFQFLEFVMDIRADREMKYISKRVLSFGEVKSKPVKEQRASEKSDRFTVLYSRN